jgi:hypothetical protein
MNINTQTTSIIPENLLENFSKDPDYLFIIRDIMNSIREPNDSATVINAITNLRRLLKYYQKDNEKIFVITFDNVYDDFRKLLNNQNQELVLHSLTLIVEVFSYAWENERECKEWVLVLVPLILRISIVTNIDPYAQQLAFNALENLSKRLIYEETAIVLLHGMKNTNPEYAETAFGVLRSFLKNTEQNTIVEIFDWSAIFDLGMQLYSSGSVKRKMAESLIKFMQSEVFNPEQWNEVMARLDDCHLENLPNIIKLNLPIIYARRKELQEHHRLIINAPNEEISN